MQKRVALTLVVVCFLTFLPAVPARSLRAQSNGVLANQNLALDPSGRIVDVSFDQDLALNAPWDRFRFDIDSVQPLAQGGGAFLGDLTGDGVPDLIVAGFMGDRLFFPGLSGSPQRFGRGTYLKHKTTDPTQDPYYDSSQAGRFVSGDIADLDGDGKDEVVVGLQLYRNVGTPSQPELEVAYKFASTSGNPDPAASIGDLNGDAKPDVVISYSGETWVFWNESTPGSFSFTPQWRYTWPLNSAVANRVSLGDINGDGVLDLAAPAGVYLNLGTAHAPAFNFAAPAAWNKIGGPDWTPTGDRPSHVFLRDADGDGLLDAYVSNLSSTAWQVLFYKNTGSGNSHRLEYVGPVLAAASPLDISARGKIIPDWNPNGAIVAAGDFDKDGVIDLSIGTHGPQNSEAPTILWNTGEDGTSPALAYQDLYTWPAMTRLNYACGSLSDPLCRPPNLLSAWADMTGDNLPDALRAQESPTTIGSYDLFVEARSGIMPFSLGPDVALLDDASSQAAGRGVAMLDLNGDAITDMLTGTAGGQLLHYRNAGAPGSFAGPLPLRDGLGAVIDLHDRAWPAAIDLNGDGSLDLLVVTGDGKIHKFICNPPATLNGCDEDSLLGTPEQAPVDVEHSTRKEQSLATLDLEGDGLDDVVMTESNGKVWLLKNVGSHSSPSFSLRPLTISRTTAGYLEMLSPRQVRLYFALPAIAGQTVISYRNLPTAAGASITGQVTVSETQSPSPTPSVTASPSSTPSKTATPTMMPTRTITPTSTPTPKLITVENEDFRIQYDGWRGVKDSRASGGSYRLSNTPNDDLTLKFSGNAFTWITRKGPGMGKARVTVDGTRKYIVDLFQADLAWRIKQSFSGFGTGAHTAVITVLGDSDSDPTNGYVALDAFIVGSTTTQENSRLVQYGDWKFTTALNASGGSHRSNQVLGSSARLTFNGFGVNWITAKGPAFGRADVYIDGGKRASAVDLYNASTLWKVAMPFPGLGPGKHTIEVRPLGTKKATSKGTRVVVDGFKGNIVPLATSGLRSDQAPIRISWSVPLLFPQDMSLRP